MAEITTFGGASTQIDTESEMERAISALMVQVGERVRSARERKGISRRVLSESSGVSQRYLAQLETGSGNISIGLLKRVAHSLDHKIEWFLGEEDPWNSPSLRVAELFSAADSDTREVVLQLLSQGNNASGRAERICLIGLRGAGKSTLGKLAAEKLDVPFLELNKEIALHGGMPIDEILALYGQEGYRKLEAGSLDRVIENYDRVILAAAGGIVSEPETFNKLLSKFHTIWLKASPQEHMDRVRAQGDERPMQGNSDAMEQLTSILTSREALYARAGTTLDTSACTLDQSLRSLIATIQSRRFLES
ncbi:helix-turn-helix transcriptional regulator [Ruegeria sp.]|uniref:helix-turn-helix transcriptional regulator n=1 Tax=Ruegeria sp. TaxID=1879320 RepID=UPI002325DAD2|nr:helix-turn-helix transcriptional regulator [Ruegeria sp.]MDA7965059.1 helix-turn-helix transcriptional regulator [Ruegeria sp.]